MAAANVELMRELFASYAAGEEFREEAFHPDVVWNPLEEQGARGIDAVRTYMERWEAEWDALEAIPEDMLDAGDRVLVTVLFRGRGKQSGAAVEARMYEVYEIREGLIVRMDEFADREEALAAAGVELETDR